MSNTPSVHKNIASESITSQYKEDSGPTSSFDYNDGDGGGISNISSAGTTATTSNSNSNTHTANTTSSSTGSAEIEDDQATLDAIAAGSSHTDIIDWSTFGQILEMDEDEEERDFSRGIVLNFFEQAEATFGQMETALQEKNLGELSALGHFLKGSSAALGLTKVKNSCEKIQHFGAEKDETGAVDVNDKTLCLDRIKTTLAAVRLEYAESRTYLRNYFGGL